LVGQTNSINTTARNDTQEIILSISRSPSVRSGLGMKPSFDLSHRPRGATVLNIEKQTVGTISVTGVHRNMHLCRTCTYLAMDEVQPRNAVATQRGAETSAHFACDVITNVLSQQRLDILKNGIMTPL